MEPTTITVNGRIDPDPWDDETYLRVDEELFEMVRFVKAWVDPETGKYCETWEIKPREGDDGDGTSHDNHRQPKQVTG